MLVESTAKPCITQVPIQHFEHCPFAARIYPASSLTNHLQAIASSNQGAAVIEGFHRQLANPYTLLHEQVKSVWSTRTCGPFPPGQLTPDRDLPRCHPQLLDSYTQAADPHPLIFNLGIPRSSSGISRAHRSMSTALSYFQTVPWGAKLLNQPDLKVVRRKSSKFQDTIQVNGGLKDRLFLYRMFSDVGGIRAQGYLLMELGAAVAGQHGIAHGGFLATIIDEVTGGLINASELDNGYGIFTATLNVSYHRPLMAQGFILATAEVVKREGRKIYMGSEIRDADGNVCTTGDVLFIIKRPSHA